MHPWLLRFSHPVTGDPSGLPSYGVLLAVGATVGIAVAVALGRRRGLPGFDVFAAGVLALGGGLLGARVLFLALHGPDLAPQVGWAALLERGGMVWYGGLFGGVGAALWYARAFDLPILHLADVAAPGVALGHAFGRLGCFAAGCCHGRAAAELPWAVTFPAGGQAPPGIPLHPVQLYEAAGLLALAPILASAAARRVGRPGSVAVVYLAGYAGLRFFLEGFRGDDRGGALGALSPSQAIALGVLALGLAGAAALHLGRRAAAD